jgi:hypothetical protein
MQHFRSQGGKRGLRPEETAAQIPLPLVKVQNQLLQDRAKKIDRYRASMHPTKTLNYNKASSAEYIWA